MIRKSIVLRWDSCVHLRYQSKTISASLPHGCRMVWSYFVSGHGKGVHDGAGAVLKQEIRKAQMSVDSSLKMQCAEDVVNYCRAKQSEVHAAFPNARREVDKFYYLIGSNDVDRSNTLDCKKVTGSRSMHSICSVSETDITNVRSRFLSCFCPPCMDDQADFCERKTHVMRWKLNVLEPLNMIEVS